MKASIRTVGLASAFLLAVPFVVSAGGSVASAVQAAGTTVVNSIGAVGGTQTWDVGTDAAGGTEVNALSAVTDPVNLDGSLQVATPAAADRAQVVHSLLSDPADQMSGLDLSAITALSYRAEVPASSSLASVAPVLQLSMLGCVTDKPGENGFATLNYEPVYNSDTSSQALAKGKWQTWDANGGIWWATRNLGTGGTQVAKLATVSWATIKAACGTAGRAYQVGFSLGTGTLGADGYADDLNLNGTTWDFAAPHQADVTVNEPTQLTVGDAPTQFVGTVTNPADGPDYPNVRYDFALSGLSGLTPADITLEFLTAPSTWTPIMITATGGTLTGSFGPLLGFGLPHSTTTPTTFRVAVAAGSPTGTLTIDNKLNNVDATTGAVLTTIAEHTATTAIVGQYVAVTPTRVVDTRVAGNALHAGPLANHTVYTLDLSAVTGVPLNESAYAFNVTAVHPTGAGNLRIGPACASPNPTTSIVNYQTGKDVANDLVVSNLVGGLPCNKLLVYSDALGASVSDVVLDLQGYFSSTSGFVGVTPSRLADTRINLGGGPLSKNSVEAFQISGSGGVPAGATAVAINVTAVHPNALGNLRIYPNGQAIPSTSNINYIRGGDQAAFAIVKLPPSGKIDIYTDNANVNVTIDVFGYLPSTSNVVTQTPVRVLDTRTTGGPLVNGAPRTITIGGATGSGVPANAKAVIVSLTAVHATGGTGIGNLRAYPGGTTEPTVSNINYLGPTADVANMAIVPLGSGGTITLATEGSTMNAVVDVVGYVPAD
jgi:hypothetical protein